VELPAVTPTTSKFIAEASLEDRIGVQAADLLSEDLPGEYDAALVKSFIQVLSPGQAAIALRRIGAALRTDGRIFILGRILNDDRVSPAFTVGFNLVFVNIYDDGRAYTEGEYRSWLETAGFTDVAAKEFRGGDVLITARKV